MVSTKAATPPRQAERSPLAVSIEGAILSLRGEKVILDGDLAALYGVETKALNRAVRRNRERFPSDFVFRLTDRENLALRCQIGTSKLRDPGRRGGRRYLPYAFTEHGAIMVASVLNSPRAVSASVAVVRAFVRLRQMALSHADLARRLDELEGKYDGQFKVVFEAFRQLMEPADVPVKRRIGFRSLLSAGRR